MLRVLQDKKINPIGSNRLLHLNFRVISATNKNLENLIEKGSFRKDLYYRLNGVNIDIPPLRKRKIDIYFFIKNFVEEICKENNMNLPLLDREVLDILANYSWPGNARELRNITERLIILSKNNIISKDSLPDHILSEVNIEKDNITHPFDLNENIKSLEIDLIDQALELSEGNISKAANILNIPRTTLHSKIDKYQDSCL